MKRPRQTLYLWSRSLTFDLNIFLKTPSLRIYTGKCKLFNGHNMRTLHFLLGKNISTEFNCFRMFIFKKACSGKVLNIKVKEQCDVFEIHQGRVFYWPVGFEIQWTLLHDCCSTRRHLSRDNQGNIRVSHYSYCLIRYVVMKIRWIQLYCVIKFKKFQNCSKNMT